MTEIGFIPDNNEIKIEFQKLIDNDLAVIPEDTKQAMQLYKIVSEKYNDLVNQAFSTFQLYIKYFHHLIIIYHLVILFMN